MKSPTKPLDPTQPHMLTAEECGIIDFFRAANASEKELLRKYFTTFVMYCNAKPNNGKVAMPQWETPEQ